MHWDLPCLASSWLSEMSPFPFYLSLPPFTFGTTDLFHHLLALIGPLQSFLRLLASHTRTTYCYSYVLGKSHQRYLAAPHLLAGAAQSATFDATFITLP